MKTLFALLLALPILAVTTFGGEYRSLISTQMAVTTMQAEPVVEKVPRSKCPICKGTGKIKAGDTVTIVWRDCDNCVADGGTPTVNDEHCDKPNCPCPDCKCGDNCNCQHCKDAGETPVEKRLNHQQLTDFIYAYSQAQKVMTAEVEPRSNVWNHLINEHGFTADQVNRLPLNSALWLHSAAHDGDCTPFAVTWDKSEPTETAAVAERSRRLLCFGAPWCGACLGQKGDLKPWPETQTRNAALTRLVGQGWKVGPEPTNHIQLLNYDKEPELREKYDIQDLPTFILIENGVEITRHVGADQDAYQIGAMFNTPAPKPEAAEPVADCAQPGAFLNVKFGRLNNVRQHVIDFRSALEALGPTGTIRLSPDGPGREVILAVSKAASVKVTTPFAVNYRLEPDKIVLTFSDPQPVGRYRILQGAVTSVEVTATRIDISLDGLPDGYLEIES